MHRDLEKKHLPQIQNILNLVNRKKPFDLRLTESSEYEDTKLSFDALLTSVNNISIRVRKMDDFHYKELTIRSKTKGGQPTELDKFKKGLGEIYFFGWEDDLGIKECMIVDINKLRPYLDYAKDKDIPNGDGTFFNTYPYKRLVSYGCVIAATKQLTNP